MDMSNQHSQSALKSLALSIKPWIKITRATLVVGPMMLFWPYAWSLTIAARVTHLEPSAFTSFLLHGFIGSQLLHSAGCIWNDICDRDFDRQVERTRNRPIAAGTITVPGALVFLFIHIAILIRMIWHLDASAFWFGILSIVVLPGIYPLMKRITYWPQAWLGIALNIGAPMAWLALGQGLPSSIAILFAGTWAWTMWYDTIYACQDKRDDVKAGVKSTALLFGTWIRPILYALASALVVSLYVTGVMNNMGKYYHTVSVVGGGLYLTKEMLTVDLDSPKACWDSFLRNGFIFGGLVWAGILAEYLTSL